MHKFKRQTRKSKKNHSDVHVGYLSIILFGNISHSCFLSLYNCIPHHDYDNHSRNHFTLIEDLECLIYLYCKPDTFNHPPFHLLISKHRKLHLLFSAAASGSDMMQPPPLTYKKWALHDQAHVQDHMPAGQRSLHSYCLLLSTLCCYILFFVPDIMNCPHLWLIGRVLALCVVGHGFKPRAG